MKESPEELLFVKDEKLRQRGVAFTRASRKPLQSEENFLTFPEMPTP
jgi:hypothetical protein